MEIKEVDFILKEEIKKGKDEYNCRKCGCAVFENEERILKEAGWIYEKGWICPHCRKRIEKRIEERIWLWETYMDGDFDARIKLGLKEPLLYNTEYEPQAVDAIIKELKWVLEVI